MTDNEIIKALEICAKNSVTRHNGLTYQGMPLRFLFEEILGFVNRQKAEIEEQDLEIARLKGILDCYARQYGTVRCYTEGKQ